MGFFEQWAFHFLQLFAFALAFVAFPAYLFGKYSALANWWAHLVLHRGLIRFARLLRYEDTYTDPNWSFGTGKFKAFLTFLFWLGAAALCVTAFTRI